MKIITPDTPSVEPDYIDGVQNLLTRVAGLSTQSLAFATIAQTDILPNVFNTDRNSGKIRLTWLGQTVGTAGAKQFRTQLDGVTIYTPASANTGVSPGAFRVELDLMFRNNLIFAFMRTMLGDSGTGSLAINSLGSLAAGSLAYDPTVLHSVTLQALVANAADLIRCDYIGGTML